MKTRKELLAEYKQTRLPMGVFQIRDTVSGVCYLAGSVNMPALWNRHRFQLDYGSHPNQELQAAWKAQGSEAFVYEVAAGLEYIDDPDHNYREDVEELFKLVLEEGGGKKLEG